ncbi:MAG: hypothetical protein SFZ23_02530 [Planctomycetota bacterium]|nr:hypothetical protein [Planctomycetota bacterium]
MVTHTARPPARPAAGRCYSLVVAMVVIVTLGALRSAKAMEPAGAPPSPPVGDSASQPENAREPRRPEAARRVVRVFDFEEKQTNPTPVPRFWVRGQHDPEGGRSRPEFPNWNRALLDFSVARAGEGSVQLPARGGSTSLLLERGVVPVFPGGDYSVSASVMTRGVVLGAAGIRAQLVDLNGMPVQGSRPSVSFVRSEGRWTSIQVSILGSATDAAFLSVELLLVQPRERAELESLAAGRASSVVDGDRASTPRATGPAQDLNAMAWFDDVRVAQLPRIELSTESPGNVVLVPEVPTLQLGMRDLTGQQLSLKVRVRDWDNRIVYEDHVKAGAGTSMTRVPVRVNQFGWYQADVDVHADDEPVGSVSTTFLYLQAARARATGRDSRVERAGTRRGILVSDRTRFGVIVESIAPGVESRVGPMLIRSGVGEASLPLSLLPSDEPAERQREALATLRSLLDELSLADIPAGLTLTLRGVESASQGGSWNAIADPASGAWPSIEPVLDRFGQSVQRWQIGSEPPGAALGRTSLQQELDRLVGRWSSLVPGPVLGVPWRADWLPPQIAAVPGSSSDGAHFISFLGSEGGWEAARVAGQQWVDDARIGASVPSATFALPPGDTSTSVRARIAEACKRAVELWAVASERGLAPESLKLALRQPWTTTSASRPWINPEPELALWRNLQDRLAGRRVVGRLQVVPSSSEYVEAPCYILAPAPGAPPEVGGAIVAWNASALPEQAILRTQPGGGTIEIVDVFGNRRPAPRAMKQELGDDASDESRIVEIPLSDTPVFIEGVDTDLARMLGSFRVEPTLLQATGTKHEHAIVLENPFDSTVEGQAWILRPGVIEQSVNGLSTRWRIAPRSIRFQIPAKSTGRIPFVVSFEGSEEAGPKSFVVDLELAADRPYGRVRLSSTLELGLEHLRLEVSARPAEEGEGIIVEAMVLNTGSTPASVNLSVFAPGEPRQRARISELAPGDIAIRRFAYADGSKLRGQRVLVSMAEIGTGARLNRSASVP